MKEIIKVATDVVVIKGLVEMDQQKEIKNIVLEKGGFYDEENKLNFFGIRGRNYSAVSEYPELAQEVLLSLCNEVMNNVKSVCPYMPENVPTHFLSLYYASARGIGWHSDDGDNDGDQSSPVISFTFGNSCLFEYKIDGKLFCSQLDSGDVIIFGGVNRLMRHRVKSVILNSSPPELELDARINLTFRFCNSIIGKEANFSTEIYQKEITERRENRNKSNK